MIETLLRFVGVVIGIMIGSIWGDEGMIVGALVGLGVATSIQMKLDEEKKRNKGE
mgnify:CR=1 FL=1